MIILDYTNLTKRTRKTPGAFTIIELMVTLSIVTILSIVLMPKVKGAIVSAKMLGVEKTLGNIYALSDSLLERNQLTAKITESDTEKTITTLLDNKTFKEARNPFIKDNKGIGLIVGSTYDNTKKAIYIFTEQPNEYLLPNGTIYLVINKYGIHKGIGKDETTPTISTQGLHAKAISPDGKVYSWGRNTDEELGNGSTSAPIDTLT